MFLVKFNVAVKNAR